MDILGDRNRGNVYHQAVQEGLRINDHLQKSTNVDMRECKTELEKDIRENILRRYFIGINPGNIKLDIKILLQAESFNNLGKKKFIVPFNTYFYPYTIDVKKDTNVTIKKKINHQDTVLTSIETEYGIFWFIAKTNQPLNKVDVEDHKYDDDITRLTLVCSQGNAPEGVSKENLIIFARIDPYLCVNCGTHDPDMKKCRGCWDNLKICVRYCSKDCQKHDYVKRHRYYCGCKPGVDQSRRLEFESRSLIAKPLTLASLEDSAKS